MSKAVIITSLVTIALALVGVAVASRYEPLGKLVFNK